MIHPLRSVLIHGCSYILLGCSGLALAAAQHAVTLYDEAPKYPQGFQHFDYVNPDAPKGGTFRQAGFGSFDSLNPFINQGVAADDIGLIYDTLTTRSLTSPSPNTAWSPRRSRRRRTTPGCATTSTPRRASTTARQSPVRTSSSASSC